MTPGFPFSPRPGAAQRPWRAPWDHRVVRTALGSELDRWGVGADNTFVKQRIYGGDEVFVETVESIAERRVDP